MNNRDQNTSDLPSLHDVLKKLYRPNTVLEGFQAKDITFDGNVQAVKSLSVRIVSAHSQALPALRQLNDEVMK